MKNIYTIIIVYYVVGIVTWFTSLRNKYTGEYISFNKKYFICFVNKKEKYENLIHFFFFFWISKKLFTLFRAYSLICLFNKFNANEFCYEKKNIFPSNYYLKKLKFQNERNGNFLYFSFQKMKENNE